MFYFIVIGQGLPSFMPVIDQNFEHSYANSVDDHKKCSLLDNKVRINFFHGG